MSCRFLLDGARDRERQSVAVDEDTQERHVAETAVAVRMESIDGSGAVRRYADEDGYVTGPGVAPIVAANT
jgi:hypothetical protein